MNLSAALFGPRRAAARLIRRGDSARDQAAILGEHFAAKINSNYFDAVPRIKGVVVVADARDGRMLAIIDSIEITILPDGQNPDRQRHYKARFS